MNSLEVYERHQKLIHSIYSSRLKIQILLTLITGNATLGRFREVTGSTSQALIPKIRNLENQALIEAFNYEYRLTPLGLAVATNVKGFVELIGGIDRHRAFWTAHDISNLPVRFLCSLGDLYVSEAIQDSVTDMFSVYSHYLEILKDAKYIHGISAVTSPGIAQFLGEKVISGVPVDLVLNQETIDLLTREPYVRNFQAVADYNNFVVRVTGEKLKIGLTVTDTYLSLGLFKKDTNLYDSSTDLFSSEPRAVAWAEKLFRYYRKHSVPLDMANLF